MKVFLKVRPNAKIERVKEVNPVRDIERGGVGRRTITKESGGRKVSQRIEISNGANPAHFEVWVTEPPQEERANQAVIRVLASHLRIPVSRFKIISGIRSKYKTIEIS